MVSRWCPDCGVSVICRLCFGGIPVVLVLSTEFHGGLLCHSSCFEACNLPSCNDSRSRFASGSTGGSTQIEARKAMCPSEFHAGNVGRHSEFHVGQLHGLGSTFQLPLSEIEMANPVQNSRSERRTGDPVDKIHRVSSLFVCVLGCPGDVLVVFSAMSQLCLWWCPICVLVMCW